MGPSGPPPPSFGQGPPFTAVKAPPFTTGIDTAHPALRRYGDKINDLGDWINRAFNGVIAQFAPLSIILVVPMLIGIPAYLVIDLGLRGATFSRSDGLAGYNVVLLVVGAVLLLAAMVAVVVMFLAGSHNLYGYHVGRPPTAGESLSAGLRATPRFVGMGLALMVGFVGAVFLLAFAMVLTGSVVGGGALSVLLIVGLVVGAIALAVWLWVKLTFLFVAFAVAPRGTSALSAAWSATGGYFWPIFGRQFLLAFAVGLLTQVVQVASSAFANPLVFGHLQWLADGTLLVDGRSVGGFETIAVSDVLPNPFLAILVFGLLGFLQYMIQWVAYSGTSALYADAGGPNSFGHRRA